MSDFIYYSFVIVGTIMAIRWGWSAVKWAFQVWYNIVAFIIIGALFVVVIFPLLFNLAFKILLY